MLPSASARTSTSNSTSTGTSHNDTTLTLPKLRFIHRVEVRVLVRVLVRILVLVLVLAPLFISSFGSHVSSSPSRLGRTSLRGRRFTPECRRSGLCCPPSQVGESSRLGQQHRLSPAAHCTRDASLRRNMALASRRSSRALPIKQVFDAARAIVATHAVPH